MARIRTIKPEFPHSESMGNISRDSRLAFILMWTIADDSGRLRGNSRMLASLLFPYDDDAIKKMESWLAELDHQKCIIRYSIENQSYIQICNWLNHQRIDKPTSSKIPEFSSIPVGLQEDSRGLQEDSETFHVGVEGKGVEGSRKEGKIVSPNGKTTRKQKIPIPENFVLSERVQKWAVEKGHTRLPERLEHFISKSKSNGYTYVDWDEAFMGAVRDDWAKLPKTSSNGMRPAL